MRHNWPPTQAAGCKAAADVMGRDRVIRRSRRRAPLQRAGSFSSRPEALRAIVDKIK
jgi:hypothetical protein